LEHRLKRFHGFKHGGIKQITLNRVKIIYNNTKHNELDDQEAMNRYKHGSGLAEAVK